MYSRLVVSLLSVVAFLGCSDLTAQTPVWTQLPGSPTSLLLNGNTPRDDDVHFVDPLHGWVARATDGIYRTTNGGLTFQKVYSATNAFPGTNLVAHFRSINFASTSRGWAGNLGPGSYDNSVSDTNMLYETFDGGDSWTPVADINNSGMEGFCAIHAMDPQHIYGAGRVRGKAYFAKSENGGASWSATNLTAGGVMGGLMDVYFKDTTNGFVVGMDTNAYTTTCAAPQYHGAIARTTNGGLSWHVVANTTVNCSYFWKMSWPSTTVGYASLQQNASESTIIFYKTTDGGATWTSNGIPHTAIGVSSGTSWFLQGIGFASEDEGWMGGSTSTGLTFNQCFIRTTDGGLTWAPAGYDNTRGMNRIRFLNPNLGFASGRRVHVYRIPLLITAPPTNQSSTIGSSVAFNVTAQGTAPLVFQWRFNGTNLAGATTNSYAIASVEATNAGDYQVVVSDFSGSVTSAVATLSVSGVAIAPGITVQPQSQFASPGNNVTFTVTATGTQLLHYQWHFNDAVIGAATNSALTLNTVTTNQSGNYAVVITNVAGAITSSLATLTVTVTNPPAGLGVLWSLAPGSRSYLTVNPLPNERGLAYSTLTRRLLIVSRVNPNVYALNGDTGADLHQLSVSGVSGGTYPLLLIGVADDGAVYAGNLTTAASTTAFKLYRWADDNSGTTPTVAFSGNPAPGSNQRFGDTLDVRGAGTNTQIILGSRSGTVAALLTTTNGTNFSSTVINATNVSAGAFGLGIAFGAGDTFWGKINAGALRQVTIPPGSGNVTGAVVRVHASPDFPNGIAPIGVSPALNLLGGINVGASGNNFQLFDLTPTNGTPVLLASTNFATDNDNTGSGTGAVDFGGDRVFALGANNGILAMQIVPATNAPTLTITNQPQSQTVNLGANASFNVGVSGTSPFSYQWRKASAVVAGATDSSYLRTNVQPADAGDYSVIVTNAAGSVTSAVATLTVIAPTNVFADDFDGYASPSLVTSPTTTNGYKIFFRASSGALDFKAIFGFDYSAVTYPTNIPSAPHSTGGTTKGLYLTVNKDANGQPAAVNLYPTGHLASGNFALKFDLWINWRDTNTSTEHALFGINHSGNVTNRITQSPSDGLFFAVEGEDDSLPDSPTLRDFSVFHGGGSGAPVLMTTNNTPFGPTPPLGPQFENYNPGFQALFPSKTIPGFGATPAGTAGLGWISGEVRQVNQLITWLLNGTAIAQYTNTYGYTNGTFLIGYNDNFSSIGDSNNFAIFDNVRVESIVLTPVTILSPRLVGNNFSFDFATEAYESYTVQWATNVTAPTWVNHTNLIGNGSTTNVLVPLLNSASQYFRVSRP